MSTDVRCAHVLHVYMYRNMHVHEYMCVYEYILTSIHTCVNIYTCKYNICIFRECVDTCHICT